MSVSPRHLKQSSLGNRVNVAAGARAHDFFALMKPRVMSLAIFTAFVGIVTAPGRMTLLAAATALLAIAVGAGAAGALNMWHDANLDAVMSRTAVRPIPSGRVARSEALAFGLSLSVVSVLLLLVATNRVAAALLGFTIFFYVVVYSMWLKFATPQNIVIGGAAGALPPVIGWASATGTVGVESVVLFLIIFLWTPPHFWALALYKASDYAVAGVPMMPNVAGQASTRRQILVYTLLLAAAGMLPWVMDFASPAYGITAVVLGGGFVRHAWKAQVLLPRTVSMKAAKTLFTYSILYLYLIYLALLLDTVVARTLLTNGE